MLLSRQFLYRCATMASVILLASSCGSPVDPLGPAVEVSLTVASSFAESPTLNASIGNRSFSLSVPGGQFNQAHARIRGTGYGSAPVIFTLLGSEGDTLASVSFTQNLQRDYVYGFGVVVGSERFVSFCSGTTAIAPLRNSASDSLFVLATEVPQGMAC